MWASPRPLFLTHRRSRFEGLHVQSDEKRTRWKIDAEKVTDLKLAPLPLEDWLGADLREGIDSGRKALDIGSGSGESLLRVMEKRDTHLLY